jgi:sugar phosphate isomerase/epimerase
VTRFRLAINAGFASNRFPEPGVWLRIVGEDLGLRYAQFVADLLNPFLPEDLVRRKAGEIRQAADRYRVTIASAFTGSFTRVNHLMHPDPEIRQVWLEWFRRFLSLSASLGAKTAGSHFGIYSVTDHQDPERRRQIMQAAIEGWQALSEDAAALGMEALIFEPMSISRENACTIDETKELLGRVNDGAALPIRLCQDVDHGDLASPDPRDTDAYAWLRELGAVSSVVHLKQSYRDKGGHWPFTAEHNARGLITPPRVLAALEESGAKEVLLTLEISHREREPMESRVLSDLKESVAYWREYVRE